MLPALGPTTGYLPKGIHAASWAELVHAFGFSPKRLELLQGLLAGASALRTAGVTALIVDGSFVTKRHNPSDYDCCYKRAECNMSLLDPVLDDFDNERFAMKKKYGGEYFPSEWIECGSFEPFEIFFQHDKNGRAKGVVLLDLGTLP